MLRRDFINASILSIFSCLFYIPHQFTIGDFVKTKLDRLDRECQIIGIRDLHRWEKNPLFIRERWDRICPNWKSGKIAQVVYSNGDRSFYPISSLTKV